MLISLDIETTGFDPINNNIIEIAVVKFEGKKIIDKYSTLINPHQKIPGAIKALTNISDKDTENAPDLTEVKDEIVNFIKNYPIVGHNISFDIEFLNKNGFNFTNERLDTLPLCQILLPEQKSYSLEILTDKLNLSHKNKHRALDDTIASIDLYNHLAKRITEIKPEIAKEIKEQLAKSNWIFKNLFLDNLKTSKKIVPSKKTKKAEETKKSEKTDTNQLPDQKSLPKTSKKIFNSLKKSKNLIYESFGNAKKSEEYITASALFSQDSKQKVVISNDNPNKINSNINFENVDIFTLKDPAEYICLSKLEDFKQRGKLTDNETVFIIKTLLWLDQTENGDRSELQLRSREELQSFEDINACCCENCEYQDSCYLKKAQKKAEESNIVFVNHKLLIQDLTQQEKFIPDYQYLIIDDAHKLEESATFANTEKIIQNKIEIVLENLIKTFQKQEKTESEPQASLFEEDNSILDSLNEYRSHFEILLGLIGIFFTKNVDVSAYFPKINLTAYHATTNEWKKVIESTKNLHTLGEKLVEMMEKLDDNHLKPYLYQFRAQNNIIFRVITDSFDEFIKWIIVNRNEEILVYKAPLSIKDILKKHLFDNKKSIILTSHTLKTGKDFSYIRKQLNIDKSFDEFEPPLPEGLEKNIEIIIPDDIIEPEKEGYFYNITNNIYDLAINNKGKLLAMYTSKKAIEYSFNKLVTALRDEKIEILGQGVSGGYHKILDKFKKAPNKSIIFTTSYFWANDNNYPDPINILAILKLPFEPPDNPIYVARASQKNDAFKSYSVPKAILQFKQDINKMIISNRPNTKIYIFDKRVVSREYGKLFLESLSPLT